MEYVAFVLVVGNAFGALYSGSPLCAIAALLVAIAYAL
jgi:hypothetical protein